MYSIAATCFSLLCVFAPLLLPAQSPRTFYIGHSLSDQIPDMVQSLSDDHDETVFSWAYQSIPGAPLRWQWDRKDADDYEGNPPQFYGFHDPEGGLPTGQFDALVLTEAVPRYWAILDETYRYADSFYLYATTHNPGLRVYLYEDWHCLLSGTPTGCDYDVDAGSWRQRLTDDLPMWESVVDTLNARYQPALPVCLIPAGQGLARLYDSIQVGAIPGIQAIEDLFSDDIHLNDVGKYFVACVHFATLHETSPVGLTHQLHHWWGGELGAPTPEQALKFQEMAWETVLQYPRTCLNDISSTAAVPPPAEPRLYPNPVRELLTIQSERPIRSLTVFDLLGRPLLSHAAGTSILDVGRLPAGGYLLQLHFADGGRAARLFYKH